MSLRIFNATDKYNIDLTTRDHDERLQRCSFGHLINHVIARLCFFGMNSNTFGEISAWAKTVISKLFNDVKQFNSRLYRLVPTMISYKIMNLRPCTDKPQLAWSPWLFSNCKNPNGIFSPFVKNSEIDKMLCEVINRLDDISKELRDAYQTTTWCSQDQDVRAQVSVMRQSCYTYYSEFKTYRPTLELLADRIDGTRYQFSQATPYTYSQVDPFFIKSESISPSSSSRNYTFACHDKPKPVFQEKIESIIQPKPNVFKPTSITIKSPPHPVSSPSTVFPETVNVLLNASNKVLIQTCIDDKFYSVILTREMFIKK